MKRFEFNLKKVYEYSENQERLRQQEYLNAKQEYNKLRQVYVKLTQKLDEIELRGSVPADKAKLIANYKNRIRDKVESLKNEIANQKCLVDNLKDKMVEAMRERKKYEQLKEKRLRNHFAEQRRIEEEKINDLVSSRYGIETF